MKEEHGQPNHANVYILDHNSVITGHGRHDRVMAFLPQYCEEVNNIAVYVRVDHLWDLGAPTPKQICDVIRKDQGVNGTWVKCLERPWPENNATEFWFCKKGIKIP